MKKIDGSGAGAAEKRHGSATLVYTHSRFLFSPQQLLLLFKSVPVILLQAPHLSHDSAGQKLAVSSKKNNFWFWENLSATAI